MTTDTKPQVTREQVLAMIDIALLAVQHPHELDAVIYPAAEVACLLAIEAGASGPLGDRKVSKMFSPRATDSRGYHTSSLLRMAREKLLAWEQEG